MVRPSGYLAAAVLAGLAGLHVAWGFGSTFPFEDVDGLTDSVIGHPVVPSQRACTTVAAALGAASVLAADIPVLSPRLRRISRFGVATVLGLRGLAGLAGVTAVVSPGSNSPRFRRLDRRAYAPLCLVLAAATATATTTARR